MSKWEMVQLGDICEVVSGNTPSTKNPELWDGHIKWITPAEINDDSYFIYDTVKHISEKAGLRPMPEGTVLLSSRAPIGKVAIAGVEMCCNQGFKNLICSEEINNRYLFRYLRSKTDYLNGLGRGATFKEISRPIVEKIEIPLPPLNTQRQIADLLDRANTLIEKRKAQIDKLDLLIKSQFMEMFGDSIRGRPKWDFVKLGDIGEVVSGSTPNTNVAENWDGNHKWITPAELKDDVVYVTDSQRHLTDTGVRSASLKPFPAGTVILSSRAPIGKVAIAGDEMYCNQGFKNIVCSDKISPIFLYWLLKQNADYLHSLGRGATFKEISKKIVENIEISVPPISLQNQFTEFVHQVEALKSLLQHSFFKLEQNYKSLMQKCFRGEIFK